MDSFLNEDRGKEKVISSRKMMTEGDMVKMKSIVKINGLHLVGLST